MSMTILPMNRLAIVINVIVAGAITFVLLTLAHHYGGRAGLWIVGLALALLAGGALLRLRK